MLNIYTGNHKYPRKPYEGWGITDHISFLSELFKKENIDFQISNYLYPKMHNILIENFDSFDVFEVESLLRSGGTYSIVLTEHMKNSSIVIWDNKPLHLNNDYMHLSDQRFFNLMRLIPKAESLITIFGLPLLSEIESIVENSIILNFDLTWNLNQFDLKNNKYDLCFFGKITPYREIQLKTLKEKFKERLFIGEGISENEREKIILNSKYNLHIPISKNWKQQSPMRVFSAAKFGRKTLFINFDNLKIDNLHSSQLSRFLIEINDINVIKNYLNKNQITLKKLNNKIKKRYSIGNLLNYQNHKNTFKNKIINIYDKKIYFKNHYNCISAEIKTRDSILKNTCIKENPSKEFRYFRDAISFIYRFTYLRLKGKTFKDDLRFLYYDIALNFLFNRIIKFKINDFFYTLFIFRPKNRLKKIYFEVRKMTYGLLKLNK